MTLLNFFQLLSLGYTKGLVRERGKETENGGFATGIRLLKKLCVIVAPALHTCRGGKNQHLKLINSRAGSSS